MTDTMTPAQRTAVEEIAQDEILEYLGTDRAALKAWRGWGADDISLGNIEMAVHVIGKRESHVPGYEPELVLGAVESILSWMSDYGIRIEGELDGDTWTHNIHLDGFDND